MSVSPVEGVVTSFLILSFINSQRRCLDGWSHTVGEGGGGVAGISLHAPHCHHGVTYSGWEAFVRDAPYSTPAQVTG